MMASAVPLPIRTQPDGSSEKVVMRQYLARWLRSGWDSSCEAEERAKSSSIELRTGKLAIF
jgi:hypothetical protein